MNIVLTSEKNITLQPSSSYVSTFSQCVSGGASEAKTKVAFQKFSNTPMGIWYDQDLKKNFLRNISVGLLG